MKRLALILMAAMFMFGCKKSETEIPPLTTPGMEAKINGSSVDYGVPTGERQVSTTGTETVFVAAYNTNGNSIEISLSKQGGITTGSYNVSNSAFIGISNGSEYFETGSSVNIKITSFTDTYIVGSFSGTVVDPLTGGTKTVTEGRFYANF